jgi:hypothetical protein
MSRMGMDSQERLAISNLSLVERSRKARIERIRERIAIGLCVVLGALALFALIWGMGNEPKGIEVMNPRYISEEVTPNEPETVWIKGMTEEALRDAGYTVISCPDVVEAEEPSTERYWGPNPAYKNPVDTPDEPPCIWITE